MQPKFETGQLVYDKRGNPAKYLYCVDGGHVVYPTCWSDDDSDFTLDRSIWPEVFAERPSPAAWMGWVAVGLVLATVVFLAGCDKPMPKPTSGYDQCQRASIFMDCLKNAPAGPHSTKYNDWDEVVDECSTVAARISWRQLSQISPGCKA